MLGGLCFFRFLQSRSGIFSAFPTLYLLMLLDNFSGVGFCVVL